MNEPNPVFRVGELVRFSCPRADYRKWWRVRARSDRFVVLTRQADFQPKGVLCYTIIDWERNLRGPCDLSGGGYGDGSYSDDECNSMLKELETGAEIEKGDRHLSLDPEERGISVSYRNNVPIRFRNNPYEG